MNQGMNFQMAPGYELVHGYVLAPGYELVPEFDEFLLWKYKHHTKKPIN
jgi:hypothetical protein